MKPEATMTPTGFAGLDQAEAAPGPLPTEGPRVFETRKLRFGTDVIRVGRRAGTGTPLLMFNGIGGNIELLSPFAEQMDGRELITFDVPGVGQSALPVMPYRLRHIATLGLAVLKHFGHAQADVLGVSWGGAVAQQFAHSFGANCRRLILCATATGALMVPARPSVLLKMATPKRYINRDHSREIAGDIYGGDFRRDPALAENFYRHVRWQSRAGYYFQLGAAWGWTSIHWLHRLRQPTLILAGDDDPLIPVVNARLMARLIPRSELQIFDCGHLFLFTRGPQSVAAIAGFLDRA
jgi:poly(3-hydroxyalkanoate) depolymerase